tara:strand:+ start:123 stop:314 length:192 start_codon:yes stop_codon:yes gene_type:complete
MKVEFDKEECELLTQLMGTSKDDPRIHGLIGTCFWFHNHDKEQEKQLKDSWTSIQAKLKEVCG